MPSYEFQILCRNSDNTCEEIMKSMSLSFDKVKRKKLLNADHSGVKNCNNIANAEKIANELFQKHHGDIHRITIVPS